MYLRGVRDAVYLYVLMLHEVTPIIIIFSLITVSSSCHKGTNQQQLPEPVSCHNPKPLFGAAEGGLQKWRQVTVGKDRKRGKSNRRLFPLESHHPLKTVRTGH